MIIINTFKIKKIVFIKIYFNYFNDYINEEIYFTLIGNIIYFILTIITLEINKNNKENIFPIKEL